MYILEKFDYVSFSWHYMNSFKTYNKAFEAMSQLKHRICGEYRITKKN